MHYIIYKTTNLVNGKFYIGKHQTNDLNDGYVGSGKLLKHAIKKYGLDQFKTEILETCPTEAHMNLAEKILVVVDLEVSYNLCPGGKGGFGYINENNIGNKEAAALKGRNSFHKKLKSDNDFRASFSRMRSDRMKRLWSHESSPFLNKDMSLFKGKFHSMETRKQMSLDRKGKGSAECNSQYNTMWITNGSINLKIKRSDFDSFVQKGYRKGRVITPP